MNDRFSDELLDSMRLRGDDAADAVVREVFARGEVAAVDALMAHLGRDDAPPPAGLPAIVTTYLEDTAALPPHDTEAVRRAEDLFASHGPEILVTLGFYALPASYAARKGVQVLHRTAYLQRRPMRRVFETTQMVLDVMRPGGLSARGTGVRTAQKVRLLHASVRHLLTVRSEAAPWPADLGVPINQEDLAGTLMTFSHVVLDGLSKLSCALTPDDEEAYQAAWAVVGHLMGIDAQLIPSSGEEAKQLTQAIYRRQIAASKEGTELTLALLEGFESLVPVPVLRRMPSALLHYFLEDDGISHRNIRALLGAPAAGEMGAFVDAIEGFVCRASKFTGREVDPLALASRRYGLAMVDALVGLEQRGAKASFAIPAELRALWA